MECQIWAKKFINLHGQIENPNYFLLLKKRYILHDFRFRVLFECNYDTFPRVLRKILPKDIFEDVCTYNRKLKKENNTMYFHTPPELFTSLVSFD